MITLYEAYAGLINELPKQPFKFPGGEMHLDFKPQTEGHQVAFVQGLTGDDLVALAMWNDAVKRQAPDAKRVLVMPYLPAARADRGSPLGAKVYADMINSFELDHVICVDPHSDVAPALYDRLTVISLDQLPFWDADPRDHWDGIIVPDIGAVKRAESVAERLGGLDLYQATKHRDFATGKLSGFALADHPEGRYLLVDDICDGGGTFVGLAHYFREDSRYGLWVTHGIFSKGLETLARHYDHIYTTDSHFGALTDHPQLHVEPLLRWIT